MEYENLAAVEEERRVQKLLLLRQQQEEARQQRLAEAQLYAEAQARFAEERHQQQLLLGHYEKEQARFGELLNHFFPAPFPLFLCGWAMQHMRLVNPQEEFTMKGVAKYVEQQLVPGDTEKSIAKVKMYAHVYVCMYCTRMHTRTSI